MMTEHEGFHLRRYAAWHERFLAYLIDIGPLVILFLVLAAVVGDSDSYIPIGIYLNINSSSSSLMISGFTSLIYLAVTLGWFVLNWLIRQGGTGQTVGKKVMEIAVLDASHRPLGAALTFVRQLAHVLDFLPCFLGYLWPAWDAEKRTFADMIMGSRVHQVGSGRL